MLKSGIQSEKDISEDRLYIFTLLMFFEKCKKKVISESNNGFSFGNLKVVITENGKKKFN